MTICMTCASTINQIIFMERQDILHVKNSLQSMKFQLREVV